jgi:hypothetical protein
VRKKRDETANAKKINNEMLFKKEEDLFKYRYSPFAILHKRKRKRG